MRELETLAVVRARETGTAILAAAFTGGDQALLCDLNPASGEIDRETTVTLPTLRRLYPP